MGMQRRDVELTKDGAVFDSDQVEALLEGLTGVTDLIVISHGWNNDVAEARKLYDDLLGNVDRLLDARDMPAAPAPLAGLRGRTFAACQLFWPSKKFAESELIPGGGAASAVAANDAALRAALDALADDAARLGESAASAEREQKVATARALVPRLDADPQARRDFVALLRSMLDPSQRHADDGSEQFFAADAEVLFTNLERDVVAPPPTSGGGATAVGQAGGAAGLGDFLTGAKAAARRLANYATYYRMKSRAGTVGSTGVATVLRQVRERYPAIHTHLVGHSFGGRLVTAAAYALGANTAGVTLTLLQAAFSHNSLSNDFGEGKPGFYRQIISEKRVSGPIVITHTKNDRAVGVAYPLASRIAFQNASALGTASDPYGGMGRNGAQRTTEAEGYETTLAAVGHDYGFVPGRIYNLLADDVITDHGDVAGVQVAYAVLSAARTL